MSVLAERLQAGIVELGLTVSEQHLRQLLQFLDLIQKWNKAYNLSGIRDPLAMVSLHLLDSLAVLPHIKAERIADIGTGAGIPGIPLAICMPDSQFVLLDSNAKKTRFVQQVLLELKLDNVEVIQARVEAYQPVLQFNTVITRAFASTAEILQLVKHLLIPGGELLAMKGQVNAEDLQIITGEYSVIPLQVPSLEAERCLIRIQTHC